MADKFKEYQIQYNIVSNVTDAANGFKAMTDYVKQLTSQETGIKNVNADIVTLTKSVFELQKAFATIGRIDMNTFRGQLGQMQKAVAEFAIQTRNIMRAAVSGTQEQFSKAYKGMISEELFDKASLRAMEKEFAGIQSRIDKASEAYERTNKNYTDLKNRVRPMPSELSKMPADKRQQRLDYIAKNGEVSRAEAHAAMLERDAARAEFEDLRARKALLEGQMKEIRGRYPSSPTDIPTQTVDVKKIQDRINQIKDEAGKFDELRKEHDKRWNAYKKYRESIVPPTEVTNVAPQYRQWLKNKRALLNNPKLLEHELNYAVGEGKTFKTREEANQVLKQYRAYQKYLADLEEYEQRADGVGANPKESEKYKQYRESTKRLANARRLKREYDDLNRQLTATSASPAIPAIAKEPLVVPSALNNPKFLEQVFSGKLTLVPDVASVKTAIAAEKFSANVSLLPNFEELRTKLNSQTFKINVTPQIVAASDKGKGRGKGKGTVGGGVIDVLQNEIDALKQTAKAPITVGTKLDRGGLLGRAQSGYNTLQTLAQRHPITYKLTSDGSGGFSLNQALANLTRLAQSRPVPFRMVHDGSGGFSLNQALTRLQAIAATKPIAISLNANISNLQTAISKVLSTGSGGAKSFPIDIKPRVGALSQSIKAALSGAGSTPKSFFIDVKARTAQLTSSINQVLKGKVFNISAKLDASTLTSGVPLLERLQQVWAQLPKTGKRTYTVNLKTTGVGDIAKIERIIALVNSLPPGVTKNYRVNTSTGEKSSGNGGGSGRNTIAPYGTGGGTSGGRVYRKNNDVYTRARAWAYPFTGNTSFGARTPAALDMVKGMGMMTGLGGAMSVIGGSFSDAVGYQNTMETAKAILQDNYKGNNFNRDYNDMVREIRDVAMRTKFTAPEAADAARFMAMAGLDIPMIKSAIAPIADVAAISDTDLGEVADKMTNIMTEFKIEPSQMRNLADMMTKTFTSTNTDMMMLAESLQYAGPMAFASGQSLAETLAMIGIMGNSGIQASMAGTTMRMMLQNLYNPNKNQAKFMQDIGLQTRDANGNRRSLFEILSDIARITGANDSKDVVGNLLGGKDTKNNIDTFDAASKLFRVTVAAGGASLLGNIDKVGNLIQQIQGTSGNSAAISLAKQNTVAGMWAQTKSAFTEGIVKVFEDADIQKLLKNTLGQIIEYLKSPEFIDNIKKISDLILNVMEVLKTVVRGWMWIYNTFGGIVNEVVKWQFIFTNIGYVLTPFIQFIGLLSTLSGTIKGVLGGGAATGLAAVRRAGSGLANISASASSVLNPSAALFGGLTAQDAIARHNDLITKYQQKKWGLRNAPYLTAPSIFLSTAYTNPEKIAMRSRAANRAEEAVLRHQREINRIRQTEALGLGYMFANGESPSSMKIMREWSKQQNSNIRRKPELFTRYERIYGHSYNSNLFGRNSRTVAAFAAGMNTFSFTSLIRSITESIKGIFTSVALNISKFAGMLASPVGMAVTAIAGLATTIYFHVERVKKLNAEYGKIIAKNEKVSGATAASMGHRNTNKIDETRRKMGLMSLTGELKLSDRHYAPGDFKVDPLLKNNAAVSKIFKYDNNLKNYSSEASQLIADMSPALYGSRESVDEVRKRIGNNMSQTRGLMPNPYGAYREDASDRYKDEAALAAVALAGANSSFAKKAAAPIIARLQKWTEITDKEQSDAEWQRIAAEVKSTAERYNPAGKNYTDLRGMTYEQIGNMRTSAAANTLQYQQGIYQSLLEINDPENPIYGSYAALHELRSMTETGTAKALDLIGRIAGEINFTLPDIAGVQQQLNLQFQNGLLPFENFAARLASLGIKVPNQITAYLDMIRSIYNAMDAGMRGAVGTLGDYTLSVMGGGYTREQLNNLTKEEADNLRAIERDYILNNPGVKAAIEKKYGSVHDWYQSGRQLNEVDANKALRWHQNMMSGNQYSAPRPNPVPTPQNKPSKPSSPKPTIPAVSTPKPTAYHLGFINFDTELLNSGFQSSYQRPVSSAGPQIHIDKLMDVQGITIASDAEERQIASAMEDKIGQAIDILKSQIMNSLMTQPTA